MSPLSIILLSPVKKKKSHLIWIKREVCMDQAPFSSPKQTHILVYFNVRRQQGMDFWRKSYCGLWTGILVGLKIKSLNDGLQTFISQDINWWTGVVSITCKILFLSAHFWWHLFNWWASDVKLHFSKLFWLKKQTHLLDGLRVSTFSANLHFGVNYFFNVSTFTKL